MTNLKILVVEGNDPKNSEFFKRAAKASCSENLKNLVLKLEPNSKIDIINPPKPKKEALIATTKDPGIGIDKIIIEQKISKINK